MMPSPLHLENKQNRPLPAVLRDPDVRYPEALVEHFLHQHTQPDAVVLDPFAGFGTTLIASEQMGRIGYGVGWDALKAQYIQSQFAPDDGIIQGDARELLRWSSLRAQTSK